MIIENLNYLCEMGGELVLVSGDVAGYRTLQHVNELEVIVDDIENEIIFEDLEESCAPIHILISQIVSIEREYEGQVVIHMLHGKILIQVL